MREYNTMDSSGCFQTRGFHFASKIKQENIPDWNKYVFEIYFYYLMNVRSIIQDPDTTTTVPHKAGGTGAGSDQTPERRDRPTKQPPLKP